MIKIRKSKDRGLAEHGWLKSHHTFSFAGYYDPAYSGYGVLRVINEDTIDGDSGFPTHPHQNMEILSYVIEGALEHQDSMGTKSIILPGEIQRMSAGTGVQHSEQNHLKDKKTHFLQIWITPEKYALQPSYAQKSFQTEFSTGQLILLASKNGDNNSITIHQDTNIYACKGNNKSEINFKINANRHIWIQVVHGPVHIEKKHLESGDGAAIEKLDSLHLSWEKNSEFLLFDLPS